MSKEIAVKGKEYCIFDKWLDKPSMRNRKCGGRSALDTGQKRRPRVGQELDRT